jgi:proteasome alpha subunit
MTMPVYVSPEQLMKDRADYARKGIARGRSVIVLSYDAGIAFVADNPRALHKISEIYDRIAFAAVGKYNEFENLRVAGVRYADLRGYSYDRADVSARGLANIYAQTLGSVFTTEPKPFEVELSIAEVGASQAADQIYRISYDGSVADVDGFVAMGGQADSIQSALGERWHEGMSLSEVLVLAVELLAPESGGAQPQPAELGPESLEVAVLDRQRPRRAFRRLGGQLLERLLSPGDPTSDVPPTEDARPGIHDTLTGNGEASTGALAEPAAVPPRTDT